MSVWCENSLNITGPADAVAEVVAFVGDGTQLFNKIIPMPDILSGTSAPPDDDEKAAATLAACGYPDWHSWALDMWGTKWDVDADMSVVNPQHVCVWMDTANTPPIPVVAALAAKFPRVHIEHLFKESVLLDYSGTDIYDDGKLTSHTEGRSLEKCHVCGDYRSVDLLFSHDDHSYLDTECAAATATVLITCPYPDVLTEIADILSGADMSTWLPDNCVAALKTMHSTERPDPLEYLGDWVCPNGFSWVMPVTVHETQGGSLQATYPTVVYDIGGSLLTLSEMFPTATFYACVRHTKSTLPDRRSIVARGHVLAATESFPI